MEERVCEIIDLLGRQHPNAVCELNFSTPFELLVAVILSAQCTDKRVNIITADLFKKYNTPEQFAALKPEELEPLIFSCGFYRNKARNVIAASQAVMSLYGGKVPEITEQLKKLPGVGNKTAEVVYAVAFGGDAMPVDTHVFRVSRRLGLTSSNTADKVMNDLKDTVDKDKWSWVHHLLIHHGRYICKAAKPLCNECLVTNYCKYYNEIKTGG